MKIILGSSSPRREEIFAQLQIPFQIIPPNVDESIIDNNLSHKLYCTKIAQLKVDDISKRHPKDLIIGADTIVVKDQIIMQKPCDKKEALKMLKTLSNSTHKVYTSVCIKCLEQGIHRIFTEITIVTFRKLSYSEIKYYINHHLPFDKAGSYGIQDWSGIFVEKIEGCYYNVVGFPISRFYKELRKLDINLLDFIL